MRRTSADDPGGGDRRPGPENRGDPIRDTLNVPLRPADDLELGGRYLAYEPGTVPERGVASVRVLAHELDGDGADDSMRLSYTARMELVGSDLLELGRIARTLVGAKPRTSASSVTWWGRSGRPARGSCGARTPSASAQHRPQGRCARRGQRRLSMTFDRRPVVRLRRSTAGQLTMTRSAESAATAAKLLAGPLRAAFGLINDPDLGGCAAEYSDARWTLLGTTERARSLESATSRRLAERHPVGRDVPDAELARSRLCRSAAAPKSSSACVNRLPTEPRVTSFAIACPACWRWSSAGKRPSPPIPSGRPLTSPAQGRARRRAPGFSVNEDNTATLVQLPRNMWTCGLPDPDGAWLSGPSVGGYKRREEARIRRFLTRDG